jgi:RNA polymerase sigma factor (TIGR02999 family)
MADRASDRDVTLLLRQWQSGDHSALERLAPLVYDELRRVARARLRGERPNHTLQATALVHEAFVRLMGSGHPTPQNRAHFFAIAGRLMRQILVDHARRKNADKRGGGVTPLSIVDSAPSPQSSAVDILALDEALNALAHVDNRLAEVVEMRFFAGLSIDETAAALKVSAATVERDWTVAKTWLYQQLSSSPPS